MNLSPKSPRAFRTSQRNSKSRRFKRRFTRKIDNAPKDTAKINDSSKTHMVALISKTRPSIRLHWWKLWTSGSSPQNSLHQSFSLHIRHTRLKSPSIYTEARNQSIPTRRLGAHRRQTFFTSPGTTSKHWACLDWFTNLKLLLFSDFR